MKLSTTLITLALAVSRTYATVPLWGQCGGINYNGDTACETGTTCFHYNDWFFQCQVAVDSSSAPGKTSVASSSPVQTPVASSAVASTPAATGFVGVSGEDFTLNGSKFTVVGTNSYWVGLGGYGESDINKAFKDIVGAGATTLRTWGFNEVTEPKGIYYQSWIGGNPTVNTGADGLQHFDKIVAEAKASGIRLIVALTNNWQDFGGMDVYVNQILGNGKAHDLFYTDVSVKAAFKDYVKAFVGRYVNEPTILAWELVNEPRCKGTTEVVTGTCTAATITAWAKEMSTFIKSIDKNHLVALGDEGFYNDPSASTYPYQGSEGIDFDANLKIDTLDFGTFHSYPETWGQNDISAFGLQWIVDHAASQKRAGKPVILEEYGATKDAVSIYEGWHAKMQDSGLTGSLYWQAGSHFASGSTHDDGYAIFPDSPTYPGVLAHAHALKVTNA
ncbi:mannanase [Cyathus striatus]|nr:mannanase [Cyathus striatus]